VITWRRSRKIETCRSYDKFCGKYNFDISPFVGCTLWIVYWG